MNWANAHLWYPRSSANRKWQKSDIWSQASYRYFTLWEAFLDPSDSYFLFADFVDFYTHLTIWGTYMKLVTKYQISAINSCREKCAYMFNVYKNQLSRQTGSRNLTGFLYTLNIYAHFRHIFLSNYWWQKSDIWSQASCLARKLIEQTQVHNYQVLGKGLSTDGVPKDPYKFQNLMWTDPVISIWFPGKKVFGWFLYTLNIYAHFSSHFSQQLSHDMGYLYEACDQISDFFHQ
jgi:hypothetical protein